MVSSKIRTIPAMKDQKKTKAQLIDELEASRGEVSALRQKSPGGDVSAVERQLAMERVRAEAMDMRATEDLRRVVAVVFQGMLDLGIETPGATIHLVDESADEVRVFFAGPHPRVSGLDWSPDRATADLVVVGEVFAVGVGLLDSVKSWREARENDVVWGSGTPRTYEAESGQGVEMGVVSQVPRLSRHGGRRW